VNRRAPDAVSPVPPPPGTDVDTSEVLDLDTSFGLSAFGSEGQTDRATAAPAPEAPRRPVPEESRRPSTPLRPSPPPGRWMDTVAPAAHAREAAVHEPETRIPLPPTPLHTPAPPVARAAGLSTDDTFDPDDLRELTERAAAYASLRPAAGAPQPPLRRAWVLPATAGLVVLALLMAGTMWLLRRPLLATAASGELVINSTPDGARVIIGGKDRGSTPLSMTLEPGPYHVELRAGDERHMVPVQVKAGSTTAQHVFLSKAPPAPVGTLRVVSEPSAAAVAVNGRRRGTTPAQITDLPAGAHEVTVSGTGGAVRQRVQVSPGATTTVMVPLPRAAPPQSTGGWLSITASTELQVFEGGRLLGTTRVNPLMLPTGTHTLRLSSESAGVDLTRVVSIERGRTARLQVSVPPGTLSANAVPWASVSIDGRDVGETPLGGVQLSPGTHDVAFTHPELGQRRQQVTVRSGAATRVSVDFRR
jgi:hypothetical protein